MNVEYLSYELLGQELRRRWAAVQADPTNETVRAYEEAQREAVRRLNAQAETLGLRVEEVSNL